MAPFLPSHMGAPLDKRYWPALDGVRAMAIGLVLLCHSVPGARGGGIGVNIFFTLSGFLITSVLLDEFEEEGRVNYLNFYARRALRLFPALLAVALLVALLPNVYRPPLDDSQSRLETIPAALLYTANYYRATGHPLGYLSHTWSLSVEEQFYLVWPVLLVALSIRGRLRRFLPWLIGGLIATRAIMAALHVPGLSDWLSAQADQFAIGAFLAVCLRAGELRWLRARVVGWVGLMVLALLALLGSATHQGVHGSFGMYGGVTAAGVASAALIGNLALAQGGLLNWFFTRRSIVVVGMVSYGLYLYHFPIFEWVQHQRWPSSETYLLEYTLTAVAVTASWLFIETPALRLKSRFRAQRRIADPVETMTAAHAMPKP